jgi:tRNA-(ms[2]io[6]A)-hydroxylase
MLRLRHDTPAEWAPVALASFDEFLQDHAANERKVSQSALTLAVQHPTRSELVSTMIGIAQEELEHYRQVHELLLARGKTLAQERPDPYMTALRKSISSSDVEVYLLDRLILFGIIEARGCERFRLVAEALSDPELADFYHELVRSEARHHVTYINLARTYFGDDRVDPRLDELLDVEAEVARTLPLRPALH